MEELFDVHNRLNFPSEATIAAMPQDVRKRFAKVRLAKQTLDKATKYRESIEEKIKANDAARSETKTELDRLRPEWSPMMNIKAHIESEARQRRLERGMPG
jgi:septal ring factor EnvC (AmiA/AmiB activator)